MTVKKGQLVSHPPDQPLYDALTFGLAKAEDEVKDLGVEGWRFAIVGYNPDNPREYMVCGTPGDDAFQNGIVGLINPDDVGKAPHFVPDLS